jgi:hypothetical protein
MFMSGMRARAVIIIGLVLPVVAGHAASFSPAGTASFSPLARQVWKAGGREWIRSESHAFHIYGKAPWEVADVRAEAGLAWEEIENWLGRDPAPRPARLFIISDRKIWNRVLRGADRRKDSLAIQAENEIFILREPSAPVDQGRLPHELVHLKLWRQHGDRIPLWLDEGMASYLGWCAAGRVARAGGAALTRGKGIVAEDQIRSPAEVQSVRSYKEMGPAFYRQAEEMVAAVARRVEAKGLGDFVRAIAEEGLSWEDFLAQRLGLSESEAEQIRQEMMNNLGRKAR